MIRPIAMLAFTFLLAGPAAAQVSVVNFQQGAFMTGTSTAYTGTTTRIVNAANTGTNNSTTMGVDGGTDGTESQALIRFDNIFGTGIGQIPIGATIIDATLTLRTGGSSNDNSGGYFGVAGLINPFETTTTLASLGTTIGTVGTNGPTLANGNATRPYGGFAAPALNSLQTTNLFGLVKLWGDGSLANNGLAIHANTTDAWTFVGIAGAQANRPQLSVSYTTAPTTTQAFRNNVSGYTGSTFITINGSTNTTVNGNTVTGVSLDGLAGSPAAPDVQALIKFDGVFGSGVGQIARRANIYRASLVITTLAGSADEANGPYAVHRLLTAFTTDTTYTGYSATGPVSGTDFAPTAIDTAIGMVKNRQLHLNITGEVLGWQNGTVVNNGLLIRANTSDGWTFAAGKNATAANRPGLEAIYSLDTLTWKGTVDNIWDKGTAPNTGGTSNWVLTTPNTATNFIDTDRIFFDDTANGTGTVAITVNDSVEPQIATFLNSTRDYTLSGSGAIAGTGAVNYNGGTVTMNLANTYTGITTFTSGVLEATTLADAGSPSSLGSAAVAAGNIMFNGGTLRYTGGTTATNRGFTVSTGGGTIEIPSASTAVTVSGVMAGSGAFTKTGLGTLVLAGTNTYSGTLTISAGTLQVGSGDVTGTLGTATVVNNATLAFNRTDDVTVANAISGTGNLVKSGTNTLTLTGALTYTGNTTVDGGTLRVSPATFTGGFAVNTGGTLAPVYGATAAPLTVGALTFDGTGTTLRFELNSDPAGLPTVPLIVVTAANGLTSSSTPTVINISTTTPLAVGTFTLIDYAGSILGNDFAGFTLGSLPSRVIANLVNNTANSSIDLNITQFNPVRWNGDINGTWDINGTQNWRLHPTGTTPDVYLESSIPGDNVVFDDTATGTRLIDISTTVNPATVLIDNATGAGNVYTFGGLGKISGTGTFIKNGTGTAILATLNDYTGMTTINAGILQLGNGSTDGSIAGAVTIAAAGTLQAGDGNTGGTLPTNITNNGAVVLNRLDDIVYPGVISGTGTLTKLGSNTLSVTGANTFTGTTFIPAGKLQIGAGGTVGALVGNIDNAGILEFNRSSAFTYDGVISGTGSVSKIAAGNVTLTGTSTYTGSTTINAGTLTVAVLADGGLPSSIGASTADASNLVFNGIGSALAFSGLSGTSNRNFTLNTNGIISVTDAAGVLTLSGIGSGSFNGLRKNGAGTLVLSGLHTYDGATTIGGGILSIPTIDNGGVASTLGASSSDPNNLILTAGGRLQYTGPTASSDRGISLLSGGGGIDVANPTTILTMSGGTVGTTLLTKYGAGTLALTGGSYTNVGFTINGGTLLLTDNVQLGTATGTLTFSNPAGSTLKAGTSVNIGTRVVQIASNTAIFDVGGTDILTLGGNVGGNPDGVITKIGTGTLLLTGAGTFTGIVNVNGGSFILADPNVAGGDLDPSVINVNSGGRFQFGQGGVTGENPDLPATTINIATGGEVEWRVGESLAATNLLGGKLVLNGGVPSSGSVVNSYTSGILDGIGTTAGAVGGPVTKTTAGIVTVSGNASFGGTLTIEQGSVILSGAANLGSAAITFTGGTLEYQGVAATRAGVVTFTGPAEIRVTDATAELALTANAAGTGTLNKTGPGILSFNGTANTNSGAITVTEGTLAGTGTIVAPVTVATGARLSGGTAANLTGTLTTGNVTVQIGGFLHANLAASGTNSALALGTNTLDLATGSKLSLLGIPGFDPLGTGSYTIATSTGGIFKLDGGTEPVASNFEYGKLIVGAPQTGPVTIDVSNFGTTFADGDQFVLARDGDNLVLNFTSVAVPEPSILLGLGALGLGGVRWFRRRSKVVTSPG